MTESIGFDGGRQQRADWMKLNEAIDAAYTDISCTNYPDAYFAVQEDWKVGELAKAGCRSCPVQTACLAYAMKWETEGIWGGKSAHERKMMRRLDAA